MVLFVRVELVSILGRIERLIGGYGYCFALILSTFPLGKQEGF